ncbi:MAG: ankyrin repeat domain-containing protein [Comamonadaceae bacterium]|nr:ankyrin repeat domain-containing protein [Comamonadaceae bacterium]
MKLHASSSSTAPSQNAAPVQIRSRADYPHILAADDEDLPPVRGGQRTEVGNGQATAGLREEDQLVQLVGGLQQQHDMISAVAVLNPCAPIDQRDAQIPAEVQAFLRDFGFKDVNSRNQGQTALMVAIDVRNKRMGKILLGLMDAQAINARDRAGATALIYAAASGQNGLVEALLSSKKFECIDEADNEGRTALTWAANGSLKPDTFGQLLGRMSPTGINAVDNLGRTALMRSAAMGCEDEVLALIETSRERPGSVDFIVQDRHGMNALMRAAVARESLSVGLLLQGLGVRDIDGMAIDPDWDEEPQNYLEGHENVVDALLEVLEDEAIKARGPHGMTALMLAAGAGAEYPVWALLERLGARDIEARSDHGFTAPMLAAAAGHEEVILQLLEVLEDEAI